MVYINTHYFPTLSGFFKYVLQDYPLRIMQPALLGRALWRITLLPVTHVLVDTWMLTVKPVYKHLNVSDDYKHTCDTIFTHFQGITNNIYGFGRPFFAPSFFYPSTTHPPYIYPSIFVFTRPNDGWTGLYIKLYCFGYM